MYGNFVLDIKSGDLFEIKFMREFMNYELVEFMLLVLGYDCFN